MSSTIKSLSLILSLSLMPALAISTAAAAPAKSATAKSAKSDDTISASLGGSNANIPAVLKTHLSLFGMFDMADSYEISGGQKADAERTFLLGGQYEFNQFTPGLAAQVGGTYDFAREVKNTNGIKISEWTTYGELTAKVTSGFKVFGGMNFNFPSMSNAAAGASIKGKIGFQLGASYQFTPNLAFDARYRQLEMDLTSNNGQGGTTSQGVKISGLTLGGRYIF